MGFDQWYPDYVAISYMVKSALYDNKSDLIKDLDDYINEAGNAVVGGEFEWDKVLSLFKEISQNWYKFEEAVSKIEQSADNVPYVMFLDRIGQLKKDMKRDEMFLRGALKKPTSQRDYYKKLKSAAKSLRSTMNSISAGYDD